MTALSQNQAPSASREEARKGVVYALAAYVMWGFYGLFFEALGHIDGLEVIAHRAFWAVPVAFLALWAFGRLSDLAPVLLDRRLGARLLLSTLLIGVNWGLFVWAVTSGRTLETSLGYFINPLLNVVIGFLLLGERLTRPQVVAVALAAFAVAVQTVMAGVFPWVSLLLAGTFAGYGYLRKTMPIGPVPGFLVEALLLSLFGLMVVVWLGWQGELRFGASAGDTLLLIASGTMTAMPLMWFSAAARRIRLSTLGLLQYIAPSGLFLSAILVFGEPLDAWGLATFGLIWAALAIYSLEALRLDRKAQRQARESGAAAASGSPEPAS